jgi:hypothetical protein
MISLQFFRADSAEMAELVTVWLARGWAEQWSGRFGGNGDFFGVPSRKAPVYCGTGGMHMLPRCILAACDSDVVSVRSGVRVTSVDAAAGCGAPWALHGVSGEAAYHDTAEAQAQAARPSFHGSFDIVRILFYYKQPQIHNVTPCTCAVHRHLVVLRPMASCQCRHPRKLCGACTRPRQGASLLCHGRLRPTPAAAFGRIRFG